MIMLWIALTILAIDNLSDILTGVDLLEWPRNQFQILFPEMSKLATCKYCQAWWLSIPAAYWLICYPDFVPMQVAVAALAMHRCSQLSDELFDRYKNRAPNSVYANVNLTAGSGLPLDLKLSSEAIPLNVKSEAIPLNIKTETIPLSIKAKNDSFS